MVGVVGLDENDGFFRIDACGEIDSGEFERFLVQYFGILWHGDGVHVDDAEKVVGFVLVFDPLA